MKKIIFKLTLLTIACSLSIFVTTIRIREFTKPLVKATELLAASKEIDCGFPDGYADNVNRSNLKNKFSFLAGTRKEDPQDVIPILRQAGAGWIRRGVIWQEVEPQKGKYNWSGYDEWVCGALEQKMSLLLTFNEATDWGDSCNEGKRCLPDDLAAYSEFVYRTTKRYKKLVDYYQVDNEPNLGVWTGTPNDYVKLLKTAYQAIKKADPGAKVLQAGIGSWTHIDFFGKIAELGSTDFFDIFDFHYYGTFLRKAGEWVPAPNITRTFQETLNYHKRVLKTHGGLKPIWLTETGGPYPHHAWRDYYNGNKEVMLEEMARQVPKRSLVPFSMGVKRVGFQAGWFIGWGVAKKATKAQKTYKLTTSKMKGFKSVDQIRDLGDGVKAFSVEGLKNPLYVIWSDSGDKIIDLSKRIPGKVIITHIDESTEVQASSSISLTSGDKLNTSSPIFVEPVTGPPTFNLINGWNEITWPDVSGYTAKSALEDINDDCGAGTAVVIARKRKDWWEGYVKNYGGKNFSLQNNKNYFIKVGKSCNWTP